MLTLLSSPSLLKNPFAPYRSQNSRNREKKVPESKNTLFPHQTRVFWVKKLAIPPTLPWGMGKWELFFDSKCLFSGMERGNSIVSEIIAQLIAQTFFCCNFPVTNYRIDSCTNFCCNLFTLLPPDRSLEKRTTLCRNYQINSGQNFLR